MCQDSVTQIETLRNKKQALPCYWQMQELARIFLTIGGLIFRLTVNEIPQGADHHVHILTKSRANTEYNGR
jgi:hypothetical protein